MLVNNAGGSPPADSATASPRFTAGIIALNLTAPIVFAQRANAVMQQPGRRAGRSSTSRASAAFGRRPNTLAYGAAKAGLLNATQTMAVEFAPKVRVNAVVVGLVVTEQAHLFYGDEAGIAAVGRDRAARAHGRSRPTSPTCACSSRRRSPGTSSGADVLVHGGGEKPAYMDAAKGTVRD